MIYVNYVELREGADPIAVTQKLLEIQNWRREKGELELVKPYLDFPMHMFLNEPRKCFGIYEFKDEAAVVKYIRDYSLDEFAKFKLIPIVEFKKALELYRQAKE